MDLKILTTEVQKFIIENANADVSKLALSKNPFPEIEWPVLLGQISARAKAREKLPTWYNSESVYYPSTISIEQSSSEKTAQYKAGIVHGESLIDLTGGFGVDAFFFAKKMKSVVHCEINEELSEIVRHNFKQLGSGYISCLNGDSTIILKTLDRKFDWMYIDPARRHDSKGKVFMLADCLPNVPQNLDFYFRYAESILIKTAPLLDISAGLAELKFVKTIHVIAVRNEVKELLWELSSGHCGEILVKTVNINPSENENFEFTLTKTTTAKYSKPQKYLYEPNAAIMKSGGFEEVSSQFGIPKLHRNSHLYTSDTPIDFPGRVFHIESIIPYDRSGTKQLSQIKKANVTVRNFPESVVQIRKKHKIADGSDKYCFFTTDLDNNKIALICTKFQKA